MTLNPLNTDAIGILGLQIVHTGEFERGTAIVRRAMELNANHAGWMHFAPLWDHFHNGEYEQALECAKPRGRSRIFFWPYLVMASACGHLGRRLEAAAAVRDLLALDPEFAGATAALKCWDMALRQRPDESHTRWAAQSRALNSRQQIVRFAGTDRAGHIKSRTGSHRGGYKIGRGGCRSST